MLEVSNIKVNDLRESIIACRNAFRTSLPEYTQDEFLKGLERAIKLAHTPNGCGEQTFLSGITVSFDLKYPNYISPELQRYHFLQIVCSSSKMHKLTVMAGSASSYNKYVLPQTLQLMSHLALKYNNTKTYEDFMTLVSNCPQGIELVMRVTTNYLQLKTIYHQRKNHKLKEDWGAFCAFVEGLPYAKELII